MMYSRQLTLRTLLTGSIASFALLAGTPALAQVVEPAESDNDPLADSDTATAPAAIVVTGSRIERAGFDQPTPTTILGGEDLQEAATVNIQQALNELPQTYNSVSPNQSIANTSSGTAPVELRGLGTARTLTLVNGRRFVGDNNLNFVPTNLVDRVELVTGGASAAWGSGAVAGVVNIILDDELEGLTLGAQAGISSRGDGGRYTIDGSFGTQFAGGAGHFMIGAEYLHDEGIGIEGRLDRPWFGAGVVNLGNGEFELQPDVNDLAPFTFGGTILSSSLAGQVFRPGGALSAPRDGDFFSIYDTLIVGSPLDRLGSYARLTYDVGGATLWADATFGRTDVDQPFLTDPAGSVLVSNISASNPFLSPDIQQQLAAGGDTSFLLGRFSRDTFLMQFDSERETKEVAVGIEGSLGGSWTYDAHFSHGELDSKNRIHNSSVTANFLRAINATEVSGQIVCAVNADADPSNDDPNCVPYNPFGEGAASLEAIEYVTGTQMSDSVSKLDSAAVRLQGDPFSLWAGPVSIAVGAEARWEERTETVGELDEAYAFGTTLYGDPLEGGFSVKEGFFEALVPLVRAGLLEVDVNGAARYSDYSLSGGIWSWKLGGTARYGDLLLRATRSRDIRAPSIGNLFSANSLNIRPIVDSDSEGRGSNPNYNPNPTVTILTGGNLDLVPEVGMTSTIGGSYSPGFFQGFSMSVDYYSIEIDNAIATPTVADITAACAAGNAGACSQVVRDGDGTITTVFATTQNIAQFKTSGFDFEASYRMPVSRFVDAPGTLSLRALATYVDELISDTGSNRTDTAGVVGDPIQYGIPKWRGNLRLGYDSDRLGLNASARYVGGGEFDNERTIVNGEIDPRVYLDLGVQFKVSEQFTLSGTVKNALDTDPPFITTTYSPHYDVVGRFYSVGVRAHF